MGRWAPSVSLRHCHRCRKETLGQRLSLLNRSLRARTKNSRHKRLSFSYNTGIITCLANDTGYNNIFGHQLGVIARPGDLVIGLSGS